MKEELLHAKPIEQVRKIVESHLQNKFSESVFESILNCSLISNNIRSPSDVVKNNLSTQKALIIKESLENLHISPVNTKNLIKNFFNSNKEFDTILSEHFNTKAQDCKSDEKDIKSKLVNIVSELLTEIISASIEKSEGKNKNENIDKNMIHIILNSSDCIKNSFTINMNRFIPLVMRCIVKDENQISLQNLGSNRLYLLLNELIAPEKLDNITKDLKSILSEFDETKTKDPLIFLQEFSISFSESHAKEQLKQINTQVDNPESSTVAPTTVHHQK